LYLPWDCESCLHEWKDSPFVTYVECPKCESEFIGHGELVDENFEEYNIYDED